MVREFDTTRGFRLRNNCEMALHFRLETQPPFRVLEQQLQHRAGARSNPPTFDSRFLVLHPQQSMQVRRGRHFGDNTDLACIGRKYVPLKDSLFPVNTR